MTFAAIWAGHFRDTLRSYREVRAPGVVSIDVGAGLAVACIALPLNLALAIACGLPASVGIVTGAVAGLVAGAMGSARLQVTGPEIALAPVSYEIVQRHGIQGLIAATFLAGLLQILLGLAGVGRLFSTVPRPVVAGFMTAIGVIVLSTQIPKMLGLEVRSLADVARAPSVLLSARPLAIVLGGVVIATMLLLPRVTKRIPAPLAALALVAGAVAFVGPTLPAIGDVKVSVSLPKLASFAQLDLVRLLPEAFALAALASLDSLLSAAAIDAMSERSRHAPDHELVAQGIANIASAAVGGMPVAGAIVRSSAALQAGARTRLAVLVQSVALLALAIVGAAITRTIPLAALAAVLVVVGLRLIDVRGLVRLARVSRFEAGVFLATVIGIVVTDFVAGVLLGMVAALIHFAHNTGQLSVNMRVLSERRSNAPEVHVASIEGAVFFGSHTGLAGAVHLDELPRVLVVDLSRVAFVDSTGARALRDLVASARVRGARVLLVANESIARVLEHGEVVAASDEGRTFASVREAVATIEDDRSPSRPHGRRQVAA
jgi:SulP family sulfate permease